MFGGSSGDKEQEGNGGTAVAMTDIIAQFQTTRIRSMIGYNVAGYKRIFQLAKDSALTLDPSNFTVTNTFRYDAISNLGPDVKLTDQFHLDCDGTTYTFKTAFRSQLLTQFWECITKRHPTKYPPAGPFQCSRVRKNGSRNDCRVSVHTWGIVEADVSGRTVTEYPYVNITKLGSDETSKGFFFESSGRIKIFIVNDLPGIAGACQQKIQKLGIFGEKSVKFLAGQKINEIIAIRNACYSNTGMAVAVFDVNKFTKRHARPMPRQMHITENFIVEKDVSGFQFVSFQRISAIYAIVRNWNSPREFTIEYDDGTSRSYTSAQRDTLLAMVMDIAHAAGNKRVIVTGEMTDNMRLMPRFAEEEYQSSIKDAFFGASSIETWFLTRLSKVCKADSKDIVAMELASRELNANVACPGISASTDATLVKTCLDGLMTCLNTLMIQDLSADRIDNTRPIVAILQSIYRIVTSIAGFKAFVEVRHLDPRLLMLQLVKMGNDFINYWTLELLHALCNCPITATTKENKTQIEFVNKHALLTDKMLVVLVNLMASRISSDIIRDNSDAGSNESSVESVEDSGLLRNTKDVEASNNNFKNSNAPDPTKKPGQGVAANATLTSHLPSVSNDKTVPTKRIRSASQDHEAATFYPNSLVIVSAAGLLESIVSSRRATSSPELLNIVLDLLESRCEVLINMLRSTSFLIMENAAILMFVLLKNRQEVAPIMKEMALSEGLTVKHFFHAVFSPSSSHRFISRFLVATWMSGGAETPGKSLLCRMIPSGLIEYLKMPSITEEHRKNLDAMEEEFYAKSSGQSKNYKNSNNGQASADRANDLQARMRKRLGAALAEAVVPRERGKVQTAAKSKPGDSGLFDKNASASQGEEQEPAPVDPNAPPPPKPSVSEIETYNSDRVSVSDLAPPKPPPSGFNAGMAPEKQTPENYRIMFHAMTNDHRMPDIIWNEQTRLELRSALEAEIKEFDREQRLRGAAKIAWNYQQFEILYPSLRDEMKVGNIYIRHFMEANDAFLKGLENPSHIVLFEKLFRRVLVNVDQNSAISILCTKCLCKLYDAAKDRIGFFDDMMLTVRMLEQAKDMELQHCLLDLLEALSVVDGNLHQLLEAEFVNIIIKYAALAHLNPDQIGNVLARAMTNTLMLKDGSAGPNNGDSTSGNVFTPGADGGGMSSSAAPAAEDDETRNMKRSMWIPDDIACPKTWFVAPPGVVPPPEKAQKGPFRISELIRLIDDGTVSSNWIAAPAQPADEDGPIERFNIAVDTGLWKPLQTYFQLRIQMLFPGKAIYSPAEVSSRALNMLRRLAAVHKSANSRGVAFYPIPVSKRIMSDTSHLAIFSQLLLSNDAKVVSVAAELIRSLVEFNPAANSKLYLTGTFFFAMKHTANNYFALAKLLFVTHVKQSFHDQSASVSASMPLSQRSILGTVLPSALVSILVNYGPERFSAIFTGDFDTPEVIWNASLRAHVVEMIEQHIGDFAGRLRQHNLTEYEYCPIPKIRFKNLDKEPYVHEYYLRNLCDENKFRDWPIAEPLILLREVIERWRGEMKKGIEDTSITSAMKVLELKGKYTNGELRKAYKTLARVYHPDKNPNGREMFEKIAESYDLLSNIELKLMETDLSDVVLFIKTQCIIYRRFADSVADQKYPAYKLLNSVLNVPDDFQEEGGMDDVDLELLVVGTELAFLTVGVSPLNALEFVKAGAVPKLHKIVSYAMARNNRRILLAALKAFTAILQFESGHEAVLELCPEFADNMYEILKLDQDAPLCVENCIEIISRGSTNAAMQIKFVEAGVIWRLMPMLLSFDHTLQNVDYTDETQRTVHNQTASNMHAILAAKALGRLGGYMIEELASPKQSGVQAAMDALLTQPLAMLLRNRRPWELLKALNENVEKSTKIWNVNMRNELMEFLTRVLKVRKVGSNPNDLNPSGKFFFSSIKGELCIGGVYVRIFNKIADISEIDNPTDFCKHLLDFIWAYLKPEADADGPPASIADIPADHRDFAVEALKVLADSQDYIATDIADAKNGVSIVFDLLALPSNCASLGFASHLLTTLGNSPDFIGTVVMKSPPIMWKVLQALCTITGPHATQVFTAAEAFAAHPDGLQALLKSGGIVHLLGCLCAVKGHTSAYATRLAAVSLLSKFLWNPVQGPEASNMLRRFLPEPVVLLLRQKAGGASLKILDEVCENPELIWTTEMQSELREAITEFIHGGGKSAETCFSTPPVVSPEYFVKYQQVQNELFVGGVYVRLFLKQPTFKLSNPVLFLEKLVEFWESSFNTQCPLPRGKLQGAAARMGTAQKVEDETEDGSTAMILGSENFLSLLTSSIVCVLKSESSVLDHLLSWGFVHSLCDLLKRAVEKKAMGTPVTSIIRLMYQLVDRVDAVDSLAGAGTDVIQQLVMSLGGTGLSHTTASADMKVELPKETAFIVELLKKIFQCRMSGFLGHFVQMSTQADLPNFLLDHVIGAKAEELKEVRNPAAMRIHAVDTIKAIIAADEFQAGPLRALLDVHPVWSEFRDQSHDLFITDVEKTDPFLIQDSTDNAIQGLLTDGSGDAGISSTFTSLGKVVNAMGFSDTYDSAPSSPAPVPAPAPAAAPAPARTRAPAPAPATAPATASMSPQSVGPSGHRAKPPVAAPAPAPAPVPSMARGMSSTSDGSIYNVTILKGADGLGLDIGKMATGGCLIRRLKEMPDGRPNPAAGCSPAIKSGDLIIGVNGKGVRLFNDIVTIIKGLGNGAVQLSIERPAT